MVDHVDSTSTASAMPKTHDGPRQGYASVAHRFLELIRFSHTLFALPFAALACVLAIAAPGNVVQMSAGGYALRLFGVLLCMVSARSAAMAFNRLIDAQIDADNPRTASRHLPSGQLSSQQVIWFIGVCSLVFVSSCLIFLPNWLPIALSIPVLLWIGGYSFAKRFTSAAHLWLGIALALSPICAWIALRGETVLVSPQDILPAVGLAIAIALWVAGFDIIYACQDADFDRKARLFSVPATLGIAGALRLAAVSHAAMLLSLALLPVLFQSLSLGWLYYVALAFVAALVIWQHAIVKPGDLRRVGEAFFNINAVISLGLSLVAAVDACIR